jgi:uncharacterized protein
MNKFECDKSKARTNHIKHGIRFSHAGRALNSGYSLTLRPAHRNERGEERNLSIAKLASGKAIVIVWTPRGGNVRIISVRRALKREEEALYAYLQRI